jgi:hypothetical protein
LRERAKTESAVTLAGIVGGIASLLSFLSLSAPYLESVRSKAVHFDARASAA